jgi:rod shape-determining protein MreD
VQQAPYSLLIITCSFLVAFALAVMPLPLWLHWARPEWVALVLIYWVIALPHRVGIVTAVVAGFVLDELEGAMLGQNALALAVLAFLSMALYQRLRVFNVWQQVAVVFVMVGVYEILVQWVQLISSGIAGRMVFLPVFVSALMWPVVLTLLRAIRRRYRVS